MENHFDFTIIIPFRDSINSIYRLLNTIPSSEKIEIIIVDNSIEPLTKESICSEKHFTLIYSQPNHYAGGARNIGIEHAHGKWLIFADADDYFTDNAFDIFYSYVDSEYDLIYFKVDSVYDDNILKKSDRHVIFNALIDSYLDGRCSSLETRLKYLPPWGKMIKRKLVENNEILFDEVLAANDVMFSTLVGFYAKHFCVDIHKVYIVTTRKGSLANRLDKQAIKSRFHVALRRNMFLKKHQLSKMQSSVMVYLYRGFKLGLNTFLYFLFLSIKYHQNIFIGWKNWFKTFMTLRKREIVNKDYLTK